MLEGTTMPTAGKTVINTGSGIDPMLAALMGNGGSGGFGGGNSMNNPLLWLITLGFLGRNGGLLGGGNDAATAAAVAGTTTPKDVAAQLNTMTASNNAAFGEISEGLCHLGRSGDANTASIIQGQSAQNMNAAQNAAAIVQAVTTGNYTLAAQLAKCCCENQLATEQTKNLVGLTALQTQNEVSKGNAALANQIASSRCDILNATQLQTCDIEKNIHSDGEATRALINDQRMLDLQQRLTDAQNTIASLTNTGATSQIVGGAVEKLTALIRSCPCESGAAA